MLAVLIMGTLADLQRLREWTALVLEIAFVLWIVSCGVSKGLDWIERITR